MMIGLLRLAAIAALVAGCASAAHFSVAVPTTPGAGQSDAQLDRDVESCAKEAAGRDKADRLYAACMIARGYWTTINVPLDTYMEIFGGVTRSSEAVAADLASCHLAADRAVEDARDLSARIDGAIALGSLARDVALMLASRGSWMGGVGGGGGYQKKVSREAFMGCFPSKGYEVRPWAGKQ